MAAPQLVLTAVTCNVLALGQLEHVFDAVNDLEAAVWSQLTHIARMEVAIAVCIQRKLWTPPTKRQLILFQWSWYTYQAA